MYMECLHSVASYCSRTGSLVAAVQVQSYSSRRLDLLQTSGIWCYLDRGVASNICIRINLKLSDILIIGRGFSRFSGSISTSWDIRSCTDANRVYEGKVVEVDNILVFQTC